MNRDGNSLHHEFEISFKFAKIQVTLKRATEIKFKRRLMIQTFALRVSYG